MDQISGGSTERDHFIPVRKIDLLEAVVADGTLGNEADRQKLRLLFRLLGAILHQRFFSRLEKLRDDYFYFSPEVDRHRGVDAATIEHAYSDLVDTLLGVLNNANFAEIPHDEINQAHREHAQIGRAHV